MTKLSTSEQLCYVTTRIEASNGNYLSTGTGFFFNLQIKDKIFVPLLVTNKHVVHNMTKGNFLFTESDDNNEPIVGKTFGISYEIDFEKQWIFHPDPNVDICVLPIQQLNIAAQLKKHKLFYRTISNDLIPKVDQCNEIDAIEEVYMIGYPNGLWDKKNNMPIIRKGITATQYSLDFEGEKKFLIDMAVYPGSSGSPIVLYNNGSYSPKNGGICLGKRFHFLGIVSQVYQKNIIGDIKIVPQPIASAQLMASSNIPINLGIVIKSEKILDFIPILEKLVK